MRTFILTALLTAASVSLAASVQEANTLLDKGDWQSASSMAAGLNSSDGYAVAAKATTLGASVSAEGAKRGLLQKAQDYANQAIKLNDANASAYFELARADGRLAQYVGILQSLPLARDIKAALGKAISLDPRMDEAYVALGLWNAELVAKGGFVSFSYGASAGQVAPNFEKAISIAPGVVAHYLEYANSLLKLDASKNKAAAIVQLQKAVSLTPVTYWDKQDQVAAQKKLNELQ
jgi:tetratricopeptide (TPR) repeat protein